MPALLDYQCAFVGEMNGGDMDFVLGLDLPVTRLCPCSKAISDYSAQNQGGFVRIESSADTFLLTRPNRAIRATAG